MKDTIKGTLGFGTFPRGKGSPHYSGGSLSLWDRSKTAEKCTLAGLLAMCLLLQTGCASDGPRNGEDQASAEPAQTVASAVQPEDPEVLLLQAAQALEAGRLTRPRGDNAASLYRRVLHLNPGNPEAIRGSQRVVRKLILQGLKAARAGDYRTAEIHLTRAQQVDFGHRGIANARAQIREWFATSVQDYSLAAIEVAERSPAARLLIEEVAEKIIENDAKFELYAANDADGVWMYQELVQAAGDQPLRGRILAGREPMLRVIYRRY